MLPILGGRRGRRHVRRIGAGIDLGQRKRGDRALRESREVLPLLLLGAEQLERLRYANRLARGQEGDERTVLRRDHLHGADVRELRKSEPTVLLRDLDAEGAHVPKFLHVRLGNLAATIHFLRRESLEERAQLVEERLRARGFFRIV